MKCFLIRHGITEGNKRLKFNGCRTDDPLSAEGREALKKVIGVPAKAGLFTSPMTRALETASVMFPGMEAVVIEDLKEMDFGDFEGKSHADLDGDPKYQAWLDSRGMIPAPGGESVAEFAKRAALGFEDAVHRAQAEGIDTIYVVAHGGTAMAVMSYLTGRDYYQFNLPNGAGFEVELEVSDAGNILAATSYNRFCGGLRDGSSDWRPPQYTPSDPMDR